MKHLLYLLIILVFTSCSQKNSKVKEKLNENINVQPKSQVKQKPNLKKESKKFKNYIIAYSDSIPILSSPSSESDTLGYLEDLGKLERYNSFVSMYGKTTNSIYSARWFSVNYHNDTAWVNGLENISLKLDVDTIGILQIRNKTHLGEICGICYQSSQVRNLVTTKQIISERLNLENCEQINDSLYLFDGNTIKIYNSNRDKIIYNVVGGAVCGNSEQKKIFYLKWKDIPCELIMYNWSTGTEKKLFIETDINKRPLHYGPDYGYLTELDIFDTIDNMFLTFELYKMKPNPKDEGDYNKYKIKVDTSGNIISK